MKEDAVYEHILDFKIITPVHADRLKSLIAAKRDTANFMGSAWYGIDIKDAVEYLNTL
jgi:hypothetical protein